MFERGILLVLLCTMVLLLSGGLPAVQAGTGAGWAQATASAAFPARYSHTSVNFSGMMWVIGGFNVSRNRFYHDVWNSLDGITWSQATDNAGFSPRDGHTSVVFNNGTSGNQLWVIGGIDGPNSYNDVWNSADGVSWSQVTDDAILPKRDGHTSVVFNNGTSGNRMWVIGGEDENLAPLNDVWDSADGVSWSQATDNPGFTARYGHTTLVFNNGTGNQLWVIGGYDSDIDVVSNDVWNSMDGVSWSLANASAEFSPRYGHTSVVFDERMWVIGGTDGSGVFNDVYYSSDGIIWSKATPSAAFPERNGHTSVPFDNRMWVIGGLDNNGHVLNDTWYNTPLAISGINPTTGVNRGSVSADITGTEFESGASVNLTRAGQANITGTGCSYSSIPASITSCTFLIEEAMPGPWNVVVTNPDGKFYTFTNGFTVTASAPILSTITPLPSYTSVNRGITNVTIGGDNFFGIASVNLTMANQANITATNVTRFSWQWINCTLPITEAMPGPWNVVVTNPDGQPATLTNGFTVTALAPIVTGISPNTGVNTSIINVTLDGNYFLRGPSVNLTMAGQANITATNVTRASWQKINCTLPITGALAGPWNVTVTNPDGQFDNLTRFTIMATPPKVTSITPKSGFNTTSIPFNITGSGFQNGATVNLTKAGQVNITATNAVISATLIKCSLPITGAAAGDWNVSVINPDGQFDNLTRFTILAPPPTVDSFSPTEGTNTGSVTINIVGMYFAEGATVKLTRSGQNIFATNVKWNSATSITCDFDLTGVSPSDGWTIVVRNPDTYSGTNNIFQFAVIAAKSLATGSSGPGAPPPVQNQVAEESENPSGAPSTTETVKTEALQVNAEGVTTQETSLQSKDNLAMVSIPRGIVAKDSEGSPLTSLSIAPVAETDVPADTTGSTFAFAGRAYELGPDGATFSPAITLTFTVTDARAGQTYTIRMFDHTTKRWLVLPTTYHPESSTVTTEVSNFCCFALFAQAPVTPAATTRAQPVPSPTQGTGTFILSGMILWGVTLLKQHPLVIPAIVILAAGIFLYGRKRQRKRRKRLLDEMMKPP